MEILLPSFVEGLFSLIAIVLGFVLVNLINNKKMKFNKKNEQIKKFTNDWIMLRKERDLLIKALSESNGQKERSILLEFNKKTKDEFDGQRNFYYKPYDVENLLEEDFEELELTESLTR